jgi:DNA-directed RNA polymerase
VIRPENFKTHLPIGFDGSANGLQHLSLLSGDFNAAGMVNLWSDELLLSDDTPSDVYAILIARAIKLIEADDCDHAGWWRERFEVLEPGQRRKLLKQPIMTFAYSVTPSGATLQIAKKYGSFRQNAKPANGGFGYLARKVLEACELELRGPKRVMDYICGLARHCTEQDHFLEWTSPSGFPVSNRYQLPNYVMVNCMRGDVRVAQHKIADGATDETDKEKVVAAAAPNFVHSLDAAHLIAVVNAAVSEGITDILTVHDCFYCLAPQAGRLHKIILAELTNLYRDNDPLTELRNRNVTDPEFLPVPPRGTPVEWGDGETAEIVFDLEGVRQAKNAFG